MPSTKPNFITKTLEVDGTMKMEEVREFLVQAEIVEGPDELYAIVSERWPELLHKVKPPRSLMH